jgi:1-aminocyclopropane-1-carboxylate deaminase/D-cysteine desulfhydrase-like pyridoxal-dependent ACC family enzyme
VASSDVWVDDRMLHPGYGQLNERLLAAIRLTARCEGLLLDPTYSGKSMAGLIHLVTNGHFTRDQTVVFLHTGGTPALFGYPEILQSKLD